MFATCPCGRSVGATAIAKADGRCDQADAAVGWTAELGWAPESGPSAFAPTTVLAGRGRLPLSAGMSPPLIGKLLVHTQVGTTARFAHLFDNPLRVGVNDLGDMLKPKLVAVTNSAGPLYYSCWSGTG